MQRPYPLPLEKLEKPSSLTLSCGLGLGYKRMILAYYLDHFLAFQGISLDFFVSCTGPEEIVPESTRGKRRKNKNKQKRKKKKKKTGKKKKKSGNLMKRAQKKFERERNPRLCESKKLRTKFAI